LLTVTSRRRKREWPRVRLGTTAGPGEGGSGSDDRKEPSRLWLTGC
jgi:hypothetical protein